MKIKRFLFLLLLLLFLSCGAFLIWANYELHAPVSHPYEGQYIEIPRGSTSDEIVERLSDMGVIRRGWLLRLYIHLTDSGQHLRSEERRVGKEWRCRGWP